MKKKIFTKLMLLVSVLIIGSVSTPVSAASIPSDARLWKGHHYKAYNLGFTFNEAKEYCELQGGHLATITSASENAIVTELADKAGRNNYWIGIHRDAQGNYNWITGEKSSYSNWNREEPNNYLNNQGYGHIFGNNFAIFEVGKWGDMTEDCNSWDHESHWGRGNFGFICEWESPVSLKKAKISLSRTSYTFSGKEVRPSVRVQLNGKALVKNKDYKVTYIANKFPGYGYAKIQGIGKYTGTVKKYFQVMPTQLKNFFARCDKRGQITAKWQKMKYITGYQLQYKKTGESWKTVKLTSNTTAKTFKALRKGKYEVRVRAYATTSGRTAYGRWSPIKTVSVK